MALRVLFYSRAYLSHLALRLSPLLIERGVEVVHATQTSKERKLLTSNGLSALPSIQEYVKKNYSKHAASALISQDILNKISLETRYSRNPVSSDRFLSSFSHDESYKLASLVASYWEQALLDTVPTVVLTEPVTMFSTQSLLYLCKKYSTYPLMLVPGFLPNTHYYTNNINMYPSSPILSKAEIDPSAIPFDKKDASLYISGIRSKLIGPSYSKHYSQLSTSTFSSLLGSRRGSSTRLADMSFPYIVYVIVRVAKAFFSHLSYPIHRNYISAGALTESLFSLECIFSYLRNRQDRFKSLEELYESGDKFFFYPVHYEPEATVSYVGQFVDSQQNLIAHLSSLLPVGYRLVIKEHPNQLGALSTRRWNNLSTLSNVVIAPSEINSRDIMTKCEAVFTIASSAGFESAVMSIPTIVFSECYYKLFPSVRFITNYRLLKWGLILEFIEEIRSHTSDASLQEALISLASTLHKGSPAPSEFLFSDDNLSQLVYSIYSKVSAASK